MDALSSGSFLVSLSRPMTPLRHVTRHLGVTVPLLAFFGVAVFWANGWRLDAVAVVALAIVAAALSVTPPMVMALNRRFLRRGWEPRLGRGERVMHEGAAERFDHGTVDWLFLTDRRLVLHRGEDEMRSIPLSEVEDARVATTLGVASDLRILLHSGEEEVLRVEASGEWEDRIRAALAARRARGG